MTKKPRVKNESRLERKLNELSRRVKELEKRLPSTPIYPIQPEFIPMPTQPHYEQPPQPGYYEQPYRWFPQPASYYGPLGNTYYSGQPANVNITNSV